MRSAPLALLVVLLLAPAAFARGSRRTVPFPVERTTILRDEKTIYTVEGRIRIPKGVEISCQKDVHIVAKGPDAVIEVEGALKVHGVSDREVIFEGVTVEPASEFNDIHLDMVIFRDGSKLLTPPGKAVNGKLFIENVAFQFDTEFDITVCHGHVDLVGINADVPLKIAAVNPEGADTNKVKLTVRGCVESLTGEIGLKGGLIVKGVHDATVRLNRLGGELSSFTDCRTLKFDGNKVDSKLLEFHQTGTGDFRLTPVTKCDFYCEKVTAGSKASEVKNMDRIRMDRCWFRGILRPDEVRRQVLVDGDGDAENAAKILLGKIGKRPLELGGPWIR